jgi:flagellar hook assembly protein FlgD
MIHFDVATGGPVTLAVYDSGGRLVKRLASGAMTAGPHALPWDGTDARGHGVAAGVYVARLEAGGTVNARRMVLVK